MHLALVVGSLCIYSATTLTRATQVFNQSEADSLTKNFDFVVSKGNQIHWRWEQTRQIQVTQPNFGIY